MLDKLRDVAPPLLRVTIWAGALVVPTDWPPNVTFVAERPTIPVIPVPVRVTHCGLVDPLSATQIEAERVPEAVGENVTVIEQLPPAGTGLWHVVLSAKSPTLAPLRETPVMIRAAFPTLFTVVP
jgi:hypothetical protein